MAEAQCNRNGTMTAKDRHAVDLKPGDLVLVKADTLKGKRKVKDKWEDETCKVVHQIITDVPSYEVLDHWGQSCILHHN